MTTGTHRVFVTGGSGYMGQRLIARLLDRGHEVRALVRAGSEKKLPAGCVPVVGDALDGRELREPNRSRGYLRAACGRSASESGESGTNFVRSIFRQGWGLSLRRSRPGFSTLSI